jgi:RNA polymerase sigma factor (TIGR02999 family)
MRGTITQLLQAWAAGQRDAMDQLMPLVYRQLVALAKRRMSMEEDNHPLRPTELVHETYLRLLDSGVSAKDRAHFYAICAQVMRHILIDHAKAQLRAKRGGGVSVVSVEDLDIAGGSSPEKVLAIHEALEKLAEMDERKARAVELVLFGGLQLDIAAEALGVSNATLRRDLSAAKAWLFHSLHGEAKTAEPIHPEKISSAE